MSYRGTFLWGLGIASVLLGCAHFPVNSKLGQPDAGGGYRYGAHPASPHNKEELFVVLTLSGGGTRAATFAYSVMRELDRIVIPGEPRRTLLDEVDIISSVSGGSFPAGYFALHGKRLFDDFEGLFLRRDVQGALFWRLLNPVNWFRLASPWFDRVDMAANYYDSEIFGGADYGDLVANRKGRPFVILNATDMSIGSRFEFTQDQFDLLNSDLSRFSLGRAAAASSAFPGLLSPVRLVNHPTDGQVNPPGWIAQALASRDNAVRYRRGRDAQSYLETRADGKEKVRRYIHLLDGGVSDNIGLRGTLDALVSNDVPWSLLDMMNKEMVQRVVIIVVDAKTKGTTEWDQSAVAPGLIDTLMTAVNTPLDSYSTDTINLVSDAIERYHQDFQTDEANHEKLVALAKSLKGEAPRHDPLWDVAFNFVHLTFDHVKSRKLRDRLNNLPTSFSLDKEQVDLLLDAGPRLLGESRAFNKLLVELGAKPGDKDGR